MITPKLYQFTLCFRLTYTFLAAIVSHLASCVETSMMVEDGLTTNECLSVHLENFASWL